MLFPMQQHDHIPSPYLICFTCDSLLKRDKNQKTKLELDKLDLVLPGRLSVECFCTAFWDLKSFHHRYPLSHEPPEPCWKTDASFIAECPHNQTTLSFLLHEDLRLCSVSVHLGAVLLFFFTRLQEVPPFWLMFDLWTAFCANGW